MRAFRSFAGSVQVNFPDNGLVLIRGQNETSHDSSGTGKTSILLAISYALDMCPFPASELQSWHTEDPMQVQVEFETPQGPVVVNRGKKNSLKIGDQDAITGAKAISEGIRRLFGLDADTLRAITYRPQNTSGLFLDLTDSEKKDFLTKILGLDSIEVAVEQAEAAVKTLAPSLAQEEASVAQLEAELASLLGQSFPEPTSYGELSSELEVRRTELAELDQQVKAAWEKAEAKKGEASQDPELQKTKQFLDAAVAQGQAVMAANASRHKDFQAKQTQLRVKIQEITRQEGARASLVQAIEGLRKQLQHALEGKCPTCFRTWEEAARKAAEFQATVANHEAQLKTLGDFTSERRSVEEGLREVFVMDPMIEQLRGIQGQLEAKYQELRTELFAGPANEAQEIVNRCNVQRGVLTTRIQALGEQVRTIQALNQKLESARKLVDANLSTVRGRLEQKRAAAEKLRTDLNAEKDFLALMGREGFLGVIFDDILREIEDEANARLARLANVSHVTIHFKSEVETQKGTVKKAITPVVSVNGVEARLRSGLSGGMYTSVEGVVDLAVMSVVQRRTGAVPGFLFLDESFNGQGNATKEAAMEILREYGEEKLVVVIDHNSEFKELFTKFVDVTCKDGRSEIV